jgi:hypothetical protein
MAVTVIDFEAKLALRRSRSRRRARAKIVMTGVGIVLAWGLMLLAGHVEVLSTPAAIPIAVAPLADR